MTTCRLAEDQLAPGASDRSVSMGEQGVDMLAADTLDIHEVRVGTLDEALEFVGLGLVGACWVQDVVAEGHVCRCLWRLRTL